MYVKRDDRRKRKEGGRKGEKRNWVYMQNTQRQTINIWIGIFCCCSLGPRRINRFKKACMERAAQSEKICVYEDWIRGEL